MNVLLVIHRGWWDRKCPPCWPDQTEAIRAAGVRVQVTGPRWPDWKPDQKLRANVERIMPDADVLYLWRPFGAAEFEGVIGANEKMPWLKVSSYQDNPKGAAVEARDVGLDLLFYRDHWDRQFLQSCGVRSVYIPLAVPLPNYDGWDRNQSERKTPVLLTGNQTPHVYPLRVKFNDMIKRRMIRGAVRPTSPYRMNSLDRIRDEQRAYAKALINTRISLVSTCPTIPLLLRKYLESLAAGCVLVGDMPHSPPQEIAECINVVTRNMTTAHIAGVIKRLLDDPEECDRQRIRNRAIAEKYGYDSFATKWIEAVRESLDARGS